MNDQETSNRRIFCLTLIYGLGTLMGAALAVPAAIYLLLPPRTRKESQWVNAADLSQLDPKNPQEVIFRRNEVDGWKISSEKASAWVLKKSDKDVVAFSPWCTHLGCAYHWDERKQQFLCPCHGSIFGKDGRVLHGPAPRPLDRYEVKIEDNKLLLGSVEKSQGAAV